MARNQTISSGHPLRKTYEELAPQISRISGPFSFLNPTRAHVRHPPKTASTQGSENDSTKPSSEDSDSPFRYQWRSRDNRKGRHTLVLPRSKTDDLVTPPLTKSMSQVLLNVKRMLVYYPVWDISYLVAYIFTWGSVIWVINAFFAWLPLVDPQTEFPNETASGGGWTAFVGATVFEVGSVLLILEAVNENREACFGWAVQSAVHRTGANDGTKEAGQPQAGDENYDMEEGKGQTLLRIVPDKDHCGHHHGNKKNLVGKGKFEKPPHASSSANGTDDHSASQSTWTWFPSLTSLRSHYLRELGFLACLSQLIGATIFWIAGFTAIPGVVPAEHQRLLDGVYWAPQVVGGCGFVISGTLFMLETQAAWYKPAWGTLGWHIGFWNLVGGIGFTLCGGLGFSTASGEVYEASLATFWGSWAFLLGSVLQWYESLSKWSVEVANDSE
ncbi:MAG: D-tyrosyl-tRNA(Tyr) deacylase [Chaenotheca gracillima]|nr:MAG: D-tyrosyl-tRNA(Tyr) deacylase [Chaenotheca gracillima]